MFLTHTCTQYHLLLTCFSSTVTFNASDALSHANSHTYVCAHALTHTSWIIKAMYCSIDGAQDYLFGQAGRLTQNRPHIGLLSQPLSLHVISHLSLLSSLYIWPHLRTISASLLRFLFITVLLTPLYFLIFFLSPSLPCGVSIWRSDSEGHSKGRGGLERGMKRLDERKKGIPCYKWVKRDICIVFLCEQQGTKAG